MKFIEKNIQTITDSSLGYFMITTVSPNMKISIDSQENIIVEFLKTKYFIWNYTSEPNGQNVTLTTKDGKLKKFYNEKFFGFYDTNKLEYSDFKKIDFSSFIANLEQQITKETNSNFLNRCRILIASEINENSETFLLEPPENKIPKIVKEWPIFTFFHSYLNLDEKTNTINLIEFGLD